MGDLKTRTRSSPRTARPAVIVPEQSMSKIKRSEHRKPRSLLTTAKIVETHCLLLELLKEEAKALKDPLLIKFYDMTIMRTKVGEGRH